MPTVDPRMHDAQSHLVDAALDAYGNPNSMHYPTTIAADVPPPAVQRSLIWTALESLQRRVAALEVQQERGANDHR